MDDSSADEGTMYIDEGTLYTDEELIDNEIDDIDDVDDVDDKQIVSDADEEDKNDSDSIKTKEIGYSCNICRKKFKYYKQVKNHSRNASNCDFCNKICCNTIILSKHIWQKHQKHTAKMHECEVCKKNFSSDRVRKYHENRHILTGQINLNAPMYCEICDKHITNKRVFEKHIMKHQKEVNKCTLCYKGFNTPEKLECHVARKCDTMDKFECHFCHKLFGTVKYFTYHLNIHTGCKPYKCEECNESFQKPCHRHAAKRKLTS